MRDFVIHIERRRFYDENRAVQDGNCTQIRT